MSNDKLKNGFAAYVLRMSLSVAFLYAMVSSFLQPAVWITFIPSFMSNIFPADILLTTFSIFQLILAVWLMSNYRPYFAATVSALTLFLITLANISALDLVFRDITIAMAAIALMILTKEEK